jgi:DNA polymerase-1
VGKTVYVVDANSLIHQVFHALPEMSSPSGEPVGAVFGFARDIFHLLEARKPDYLFCAFDLPGKTFRHALYEPYKAHRAETHVDLVPQFASIRRMLQAMGVPCLGCESYEADDVLATVARLTDERGGECFLVTADKDCRQLITDRVKVYNIRKDLVMDRAGLEAEWGVAPEQVVDFQALVGDSTDNVPGVPLIGPKLAQQLLKQYGTLEGVLDHAHEVSGVKRKQNLIEGRELALLSRMLVRLDANVPCGIPWSGGTLREYDAQRLAEIFRGYGFRSLVDQAGHFGRRLGAKQGAAGGTAGPATETPGPATQAVGPASRRSSMEPGFLEAGFTEPGFPQSGLMQPGLPTGETPVPLSYENGPVPLGYENGPVSKGSGDGPVPLRHWDELPAPPPDKPCKCCLVDTPEALAELVEQLRRQPSISIDLETTHVWPRWAQIVGFSLAWNDDEAYYVPVCGPAGERCLDRGHTLELLRPILEDAAIEKTGQNLKYDMIVLRSAGVAMAGVAFDTMVASYLLEAGQRNHNLNDVAHRYLGRGKTDIAELIGSGKNQKRMDEVSIQRVARYACDDAILPLRLRPILGGMLQKAGLSPLFADLEMPLVEVLVELEYNGIKIDCERLRELSGRFGERIEALRQEVYALAGREFNVASPKQLQEVLFNELKLPSQGKTKTGLSTDADVLEELAAIHPLPEKILEFRQYSKLKGTYVDALPAMVHPQTKRVHASFHQAVAATGRLSSSDPNLQNIPIRTQAGREIRSAFVPGEEGWVLVAADYSQIELRVLAHFSQDEGLLGAFARDEDIHAQVASGIYGVPLAEVTDDMRRQAKAVNFGVIYGQSPFGLAKELRIPKDEAARFIDTYFQKYPGIARFLDAVLAECSGNEYVSTILGRQRAIRGVRPTASRQRNLSERTAINTVIQGSAADLIKQAMIATYRRLRREQFEARMLLQIHDELVFETPREKSAELARLVTEEMAGAQALRVPLKVDVKIGANWNEMKRVPPPSR